MYFRTPSPFPGRGGQHPGHAGQGPLRLSPPSCPGDLHSPATPASPSAQRSPPTSPGLGTQLGLAAHNHLSFLIRQEDSLDSKEPCSQPESLQGKGTAEAVEGTAYGLQERLRRPAPNHTGTSSPSDGPGSPPGSQGPGFYLMHPLPHPQALGGRLQLGLNRSVYVTVSAP